jgi:hypothetical protein
MSLSDDVKKALNSYHSGARAVGGYRFPEVSRSEADRIPRLETAVAALADALELIAERVDELEKRSLG